MKKLFIVALCAIALDAPAQFTTNGLEIISGAGFVNVQILPGGYFGVAGKTNLVSRVESNGVVTFTFRRDDTCYAAVYPPCSGHSTTWIESFTNIVTAPTTTKAALEKEMAEGLQALQLFLKETKK